MDLWQLHIFVSVVEQKSFSRASEQIHLSQPTVSTHIKELEGHFQCRLLDRLGKVTEPTRAGEILYDYAKRMLALKQETQSAMLDFLGHTKGQLIIGGSSIPAGYILPRMLGAFKADFPDVSILLTVGDTGQIIRAVKDGELELGVVGAKTSDPDIVQEKLVEDEMKLVVPAGHEWADRISVTCKALLSQPLIAREQGSGTWKTVLASMEKAGIDLSRLEPAVTMGNSVSVIQGILNNVGISILSTIAVAEELARGRLHALSIEDLDLSRHFYLTLSRKRTRSPICEKFIHFLKDQVLS
ncbi:selenium metabolism-associated LysR family transcriptional regulator [Desulfobacter postgatei]|uniref:selenium metabolism-associated LysR family transcriptional regulator n=1 Tax=Desulfobacter postgatei TaxID=2293 RepID=UPI00259BA55D|nr:selenium metabolism-associated LysR family transcriptional regulator [uncultured Desulfobacter sp.]